MFKTTACNIINHISCAVPASLVHLIFFTFKHVSALKKININIIQYNELSNLKTHDKRHSLHSDLHQ